MRPFLIVTSSWPLLRIPASRPMPSVMWPSRSIVMPGAPTMSPWPPQSMRSLRTRVLCMTIWPQFTSAATGAGATVQAYIFVSKLLAESVARTQNSYGPASRPVYVFGDAQPSADDQSTGVGGTAGWSTHWNVTPDCRVDENWKVARVSTVTLSGVESIDAEKSPSATFQVWTAGDGSRLPEKSSARTSNGYSPFPRLP